MKKSIDAMTHTSKLLSLVLRHNPQAVGITVDEHGWADVEDLIAGVNNAGTFLDMELLEQIVKEDEKQRYSFDREHRLIRANQGHSIPVDVELEARVPEQILYHGTAEKFLDSIFRQGLQPKSRLYVHLSKDVETARKVGRRHGKPVVLTVDTAGMVQDGYPFYISANGIWLTKEVPVSYLKREEEIG